MNRNKAIRLSVSLLLSILFLGFLVSSLRVHAATKQQKKKVAAKRAPKTSSASSPKTVGDILKKIEKKSQTVNFKKSQSSLPQFKAQSLAPVKPVNYGQVKPPSSKKLYYEEGTDEAELERATDEGIQQLYTLIKRYSKSSQRGELWLRLAEAYVEKARLIEYKLLNKHDADMQAFLSGKRKQKPKLDLSPAVAWNKKAVQLYEWFLRDFPKDPKVDQALFFLGFNHFELKSPKKGEEYYLRLTKEFPRSPYVSESNFALGEYHFDAERWKDALVHYSKVATQKSSRLYSFAMYKIAWCHYKLNNSKKGLAYIEQVILEGRRSKGQKDKSLGGVSRIRLATEAIKDLIVFFSEAGDYTRARSYFESIVGEKSANANLAKLAYYYSDTGNRTAAQFIFKDLIDQDPNSIKAYDYQYAIVKMQGTAGNSKAFNDELYAWIDTYGPGSSWQKINEANQEAIKKANELMETLLRNHVLQQHQIAQNARTKSAQKSARSGYETYFNTFRNSPKAEEMHFFFGELLFDVGEFEKAAQHYSWVVENTPKSQYFDKALLNTLLAYEKRLPSEDKIKKIVGTSTEPVEFDDAIKAFERAAYNFLEKAPNSENAVGTKYRLGALYYLFNQFDKAIPVLQDIVRKYPKTQYAKFSANHLLDIYNLKKDYTGLQSAANEMLAIPDLARSDLGNQIKTIKLNTDFKLADELEKKKDYGGSAKAYEDFAFRNKASNLATAALFNSAVNYERAGNLAKSIAMYALVAGNKNKATQDLAKKSTNFLPILYEKTGQYLKAAQLFEAYAKANPKDSASEGYHYNAAIIYDGLNAYSAAITNYDAYMKKHRNRDRVEVLFLIAKIYERQGLKDRAISQYNQYIQSGSSNIAGIIEAHYTIARLHESLGRKKPTQEWFEKTVNVQRRLASRGNSVGASFAAEAKFKLVYPIYQELTSLKIPANPAKQGAVVQRKLALTSKLKDQLKAVIAYDDAYQIVAALSTQGQALHHMYSAILSTPVPKGLKPDELKQYQAGVEKIAAPFKDQAIETYQTAISRGHELQGYNDYLVSAMKNLNQLAGKNDSSFDARVLMTELPDWMEL